MGIKRLVPPVVKAFYHKLFASGKGKYEIGNYEIEIPPNFVLPGFQKEHKLYDRFLPVLASKLSSDGLIIDVGANIGDTTTALLQHCNNPILCIEPSDVFFPYLERNLNKLPHNFSDRVKTIKCLVGTGSFSGELEHSEESTAKVKRNTVNSATTHTALDKLIDDTSKILLLKVDTDGFDFDVIRSAEKILTDSQPILFWENEISEKFQSKGFEELYALLQEKGYTHIYIFDNFGNLITGESDFKTLKDINAYVYSMKQYRCTRTLYYTDILAATGKHHLTVKDAVEEYKSKWINK